jgi:hypothetical protein
MAVMAMGHVPSLAVTKSSAAYHHHLGKRTAVLRMVMKKQVGGMRQSSGVVCAV